MRIDWWTLALQAVNVLVLLWILKRFLFRPVAGMIAARQEAVTQTLQAAEAEKAAAAAARTRAEAEASAAAEARRTALDDVAQEAETRRRALLAEADAELAKRKAAADAEIAAARAAAETRAADSAGRLALDIAARLIDRLPAEVRVAGFVDGLADAVAALPEGARNGIGSSAPVRLLAPRPLTEDEEAACRQALGRALGREVDIAVRVEHALIAGLEIETDHALVRNSFRADLERVAKELAGGRHDAN